MFDLDGKVALVTGANRGIGRKIALTLAEAGANIALVARDKDKLNLVADEIRALGKSAEVFSADLNLIGSLASLAQDVDRMMGGIDILVNNAGINIPQESIDVTEDAWDAIMDLNLKSAFFLAQAVGKLMILREGGGRIINISSQTGSVALAKRAVYCASKAGMNLITKVLAVDWAQYGILVNAVAPTFIETDFTKDALADPDFREYALSKNVLKRLGKPEDVAGAVLYLSTDAAKLVTGHVLMVDGGWTAH